VIAPLRVAYATDLPTFARGAAQSHFSDELDFRNELFCPLIDSKNHVLKSTTELQPFQFKRNRNELSVVTLL